jgi:hypothetical protein
MIYINFILPQSYDKLYGLFSEKETLSNVIFFLKNKFKNNSAIHLILNEKVLICNSDTSLVDCGVKNNDVIYVKQHEMLFDKSVGFCDYIDLKFVCNELKYGIELAFNTTDTLNNLTKAIKDEMNFKGNINLSVNNKLINCDTNNLILDSGIKNNDVIYINIEN